MARIDWSRDRDRSAMRRVRTDIHDAVPVPGHELPVPVYEFDLECGLRLGLVRHGGELKYARYDRTAGRWRLQLSPWMRDEIDYELDRLDLEAAEREEGIHADRI